MFTMLVSRQPLYISTGPAQKIGTRNDLPCNYYFVLIPTRRFQQASLYSRLSRDAGRQARAGCDLTLMRVHFLRDNLFYLHVRDHCRIQIHTI